MNRGNLALLDKLGPDWRHVAGLSEELRHAWLSDHFAQIIHLTNAERRQHLTELTQEARAMSEAQRGGLLRAGLLALVDLPDAQAAVITACWQQAIDRMSSEVAYVEVISLQAAARHIPEEDSRRLSQVWPRVFNRDAISSG